MKKLMLILSLILTMALLTGCTASPSIAPAKLSKDAAEIADLMGGYTAIYDLKLNRDVRTVHVNLYRLQEGNWQVCSGGGLPPTEMTERIMVWFDASSGKASLSALGSKVSFTMHALDLLERSVGVARADDEIVLEWEKEAPLYMYMETSADYVAFSVNDFYHPEKLAQHERVYCLTVMVSREESK